MVGNTIQFAASTLATLASAGAATAFAAAIVSRCLRAAKA
jgi:hypothetical protein